MSAHINEYLVQKMNFMTTKESILKEYLTIQESAELLGISERKIYYLMQTEVLPFYRMPTMRRRFCKREDLMGLMQLAAA